jgi:hypothetical protein
MEMQGFFAIFALLVIWRTTSNRATLKAKTASPGCLDY